MRTACLFCEVPVKPRSWLPFAPCPKCKEWRQVVLVDAYKPAEALYFDSYMINFWLDVAKKQCVILTSDGTIRFPMPSRKDAQALTRLLYAASVEYNTDYVSQDHVKELVANAVDSYWHAMRNREKKIESPAQA